LNLKKTVQSNGSIASGLLQPYLSQDPAARLIRQTARTQWRLIATNLSCNLVQAFCEGATLGVVFLAVEVLSAPQTGYNWKSIPLLGQWPAGLDFLNGLPASFVFLTLLSLAVFLKGVQCIAEFLTQVSITSFGARCRTLITAKIHSQVLSFNFSCVSNYKIGDLTDYSREGPEAIKVQIEESSSLFVAVLLSLTYLAVLVRISPWLVIAVLLIGSLITFVQQQLLPRIRRGSEAVTLDLVSISSRITEDFQGIRLLHTSGQLTEADRRLRANMSLLEMQLRAQGRRLAVVAPLSGFLPILAIALIASLSLILFGARSSGVLPSLVTFALALQKLTFRLTSIANVLNKLADNSARLGRLNQILSPQGKQFRRQNGRPFVKLLQGISFENVCLQYDPELPLALSGLSFSLPRGKMVALVGPSGAGKSSIADLLTGLYAPTSGKILIDDIEMDQIDLSGWQQRLGVVSQDTFLFNASISENIAFGTNGVTQTNIKSACVAAQASGFIESLPDSYETIVGERGYRLSGGQRQRLSLARAILRDPELLILDEATSALDSQSERLVQEAIERFERTHTVLVIAHRLSTIIRADEILVLDRGVIVQRGTHISLLAQEGLYSELWNQQVANSKHVVN
jgi:ATP-binding cassette, subfamily B, bacterial MsbA